MFALIVVLGYYLQTDMGKNVPKGQGEDESVAGRKKSRGFNIGMNNL